MARLARRLFVLPVHLYRYTLSAFIGRSCRHLPSCSEYMIEAVERHGIWPGGWMGFARICRCRPGGTSGLDFVCEALPPEARWYAPWRYGLWRRANAVPPGQDQESGAIRGEARAGRNPSAGSAQDLADRR